MGLIHEEKKKTHDIAPLKAWREGSKGGPKWGKDGKKSCTSIFSTSL